MTGACRRRILPAIAFMPRRRRHTKLKTAELVSRERAAHDFGLLVADVRAEDLAATVLRRASQTGLA